MIQHLKADFLVMWLVLWLSTEKLPGDLQHWRTCLFMGHTHTHHRERVKNDLSEENSQYSHLSAASVILQILGIVKIRRLITISIKISQVG